jgi:hypothetical protein
VTQRWIEIVVGRLVTDEAFRRTFLADPHRALQDLVDQGTHLTQAEMTALVAVDTGLWDRVARHVDPRLLKAGAKS